MKANKIGKSIKTYNGYALCFMYRGKTYNVEYKDNQCYAMGSTPKEQHKEAQKKIDALLDNQKLSVSKNVSGKAFDIEEIYKILDW